MATLRNNEIRLWNPVLTWRIESSRWRSLTNRRQCGPIRYWLQCYRRRPNRRHRPTCLPYRYYGTPLRRCTYLWPCPYITMRHQRWLPPPVHACATLPPPVWRNSQLILPVRTFHHQTRYSEIRWHGLNQDTLQWNRNCLSWQASQVSTYIGQFPQPPYHFGPRQVDLLAPCHCLTNASTFSPWRIEEFFPSTLRAQKATSLPHGWQHILDSRFTVLTQWRDSHYCQGSSYRGVLVAHYTGRHIGPASIFLLRAFFFKLTVLYIVQ